MFGIQITKECKKNRTQLIKFLNNNNIETRTFFCPLNLQPFLKKIKNYKKNKCPVANRMWHEGIYLPSGNNLKKNEVKKICNLIVKFTTS
jgi:perosamine synthetase